MSEKKNSKKCPLILAGALDNKYRRLHHDPNKLLNPYINPGMTVLDLGCGPGFFSVEIAKMLKNSGKVIAADLQQGMLEILIKKIRGTELEKIIETHKCENSKIGVSETVDFILAFYMIHEVPDQEKLFEELKSILNPDGKIYIIEPKFHVSKKSFQAMVDKIKIAGFEIIDTPKVFFSRTLLLKNKK